MRPYLRVLLSAAALWAALSPAPGAAGNNIQIDGRKIIVTARLLMIIPWEVHNPDAAPGLTRQQRQEFKDIRGKIEALDSGGISYFRSAIEPEFKQLPPFKGCYEFKFNILTEIVDNIEADVRGRVSGHHVLRVLSQVPVPLPPDPGETAVKMWGPALPGGDITSGGDPYSVALRGTFGVYFHPEWSGSPLAGVLMGALVGFGQERFNVSGHQSFPAPLTPEELGRHLERVRGEEFPDPECTKLTREYKFQQDFMGSSNRATYTLKADLETHPDDTVTGEATLAGEGWGTGPGGTNEYGAEGTFEVTGRRTGDTFFLNVDGAWEGWDTLGFLAGAGPQHFSWTIEAGPLDEDGVWEDVKEQTECVGEQGFIQCAPGSRQQIISVLREEKPPKEGGTPNGAPGGGGVASGGSGDTSRADNDSAVATLTSALVEGDVFTRRGVAEVLDSYGVEAATAADALVEATGADDATLQRLAATALGRIGPDAGSAAPSLRRLLEHEDATVRIAAGVALRQVGGDVETAVPILTEAFASEEPGVIAAAAAAAGSLGSAGEALVALLRQLLDQSQPWTIRVNAAFSLWQITGETDRSVLIEALENGTPPAQVTAAEALAAIHLVETAR